MNTVLWLILPAVSCASAAVGIYKGHQNNKKLDIGYKVQCMYPDFVHSYELDGKCKLQIIYPQDYYKKYGSVGMYRRKRGENIYIPTQIDGTQINLISLAERNRRVR